MSEQEFFKNVGSIAHVDIGASQRRRMLSAEKMKNDFNALGRGRDKSPAPVPSAAEQDLHAEYGGTATAETPGGIPQGTLQYIAEESEKTAERAATEEKIAEAISRANREETRQAALKEALADLTALAGETSVKRIGIPKKPPARSVPGQQERSRRGRQ